jgi:hypothetical protein
LFIFDAPFEGVEAGSDELIRFQALFKTVTVLCLGQCLFLAREGILKPVGQSKQVGHGPPLAINPHHY